MFKSYLKSAWRSLLRNRVFSLINIFGLSLGITVFLLIMEYVAFEWSANRFNKNYDHLYRVSTIGKDGKSDYYLSPGMGKRIKNNFPAIAKMARIGEGLGNGVMSVPDGAGGRAFRENHVSFVDGDFLNIFSFPVLRGSASLSQPKTMAISHTQAIKYFGTVNAVGKTVQLNNQFGNCDYTIAAVFEDMPQQSDIKADILLSFSTLENPSLRKGNDWADPEQMGSGYAFIYYQLQDNVNTDRLSAQATQLMRQLSADSKSDVLAFQPMKDLHLAPSFNYRFQTFGSLVLVVSFLSVAFLLLIVAWVNYINLSTAQAISRAREAGIRKVIGATRMQLITQYLTETFLLIILSITVAFIAVSAIQDAYNNFLGKQLYIGILNQGYFWIAGSLLILFGTLLSGGYVAFVLSNFSALKTLRSSGGIKIGGVSLRKGLVVFQFTTSIVFILSTIILYRQLLFMQNQDLGIHLQKRIVINGPSIATSSTKTNSLAFKHQLSLLPFVTKYAASNNVPGKGYNFSTAGITRYNDALADNKKSYAMLIVDDKYFDTYDIRFLQGGAFQPFMLEHGWTKTKKVILNQAAVRQLGFKPGENVIGQKIQWNGDFEIVGVIKDYHHLSLHDFIKPMVFLPALADGYFTVKLAGADMAAHIGQILKIYQNAFPGEPFSYSFINEVFDQQYQGEQRLGSGFLLAAALTILIACLGLFGLAAFTVKQKVKEIGIRKVLGASVFNIINLVSKDFIALVAIAFVIAAPVAWLGMNKWLQDFAYRVSIQWWMFAAAGLVSLGIAWITISFQSVKAAMANPVKSLRSE
jgi:putative ABC transport system permease protein